MALFWPEPSKETKKQYQHGYRLCLDEWKKSGSIDALFDALELVGEEYADVRPAVYMGFEFCIDDIRRGEIDDKWKKTNQDTK
jgi:hypothetical protein